MLSRRVLLVALVGLLACAGVRAEDDVDESAVVVLTDKNFKDKLGSVKYALVSGDGGEIIGGPIGRQRGP